MQDSTPLLLVIRGRIPDLVFLIATFFVFRSVAAEALRRYPERWHPAIRAVRWVGTGLALLTFLAGCFAFFEVRAPQPIASHIRGAAFLVSMLGGGRWLLDRILALATRLQPAQDPGRRVFLTKAADAAMVLPVSAIGYGVFIERHRMELKEVELKVAGLHKDLDGLRLVQLTDIHLGPYFTARSLERAVAMANEAKGHAGLLTGDLISYTHDPLEECLGVLRGFKTDAGLYGCNGNHEGYAGCRRYLKKRGAELGMKFLWDESEVVRFGNASLNLTGVDYQKMWRPYLTGITGHARPDAFNVLLSHNPDVFPMAATLGYDLTMSGHTHGGQIQVEFYRDYLNPVRFATPYVRGLYQENGKAIYVSRGLGTVAAPIRLGSTPEVTVVRLCAT